MNTLRAELTIIGKRQSTWVLLGVMLTMTVVFAYVLPYATYLSDTAAPSAADDLQLLLPDRMVGNLVEGMPFYLGMVSLVLGAMALGNEFNWKTVKTTLLQAPDRRQMVAAKFGALVCIVAVFTVVNFAVAGITSIIVAVNEGESIGAPSVSELIRGFGAGWLILSLWAVFGALLATLSRGTAMAIGLGILYGLLVEGLLGRFVSDVDGLGDVSYAFIRTNAYSLIEGFGVRPSQSGEPGAFAGPFVDPWQAIAVMVVYMAVFAGITGFLFQKRDVS